MCGCGVSTSNVAADSAIADPTGTDQTMYLVMFFNGETQTVQGLDAARTLLMTPSARATETAQEADIGGTYKQI